MNKKGKKQIIFSNDTYPQFQSRSNRIRSVTNKESPVKIKSFDFTYGFRDYLRFSLSKLILRDDIAITYIPQKNTIIGEHTKCKNLINKIIDDANRYKIKLVKFNAQHDIDQIQYWLDENAIIYRPGVIEVALRQLEKKHLFMQECDTFRQKIRSNNIVLVKMPREKEESTSHLIQKIVNEQEKIKSQQSSKQQTNISSDLSMAQNNINGSNMLKDIENEHSTLMQSHEMSNQLSQESYHITQNDQSLYRQSFNIYYNHKTITPQEKPCCQ